MFSASGATWRLWWSNTGLPECRWIFEYNRIASPEKTKVEKRVSGLHPAQDKKRSVFPDLIVHDRSESSKDHNILVVEAKKQSADPSAEAYDRQKLNAYQHDLITGQ